MKLHLPTGLRKALLACLATMAAHCTPRRTVTSGTVLLGAFFLLWGTSTPAKAFGESSPTTLAGGELTMELETDFPDELSLLGDGDGQINPVALGSGGIMPIADIQIDLSGETYTISGNSYTPGAGGTPSSFDGSDTLHFTYSGEVNVTLTGEVTVTQLSVGVGTQLKLNIPTAQLATITIGSSGSEADTNKTNILTATSLSIHGAQRSGKRTSFTVYGSATLSGSSGGEEDFNLLLDNADLEITGNLTLSSSNTAKVQNGGSLTIGGDLYMKDPENKFVLEVSGKSTVEVKGQFCQTPTGHAGPVAVGDESGMGTLIVGTEGSADDINHTEVFKSRALLARNGSHVIIHGSVNLYGLYNDYTLFLDGCDMTVSGDVILKHSTPACKGKLQNGASLTVTGKLGIDDLTTGDVLTVEGGASVAVGSLAGTEAGHTGRVKVGGDETSGKLTVGDADSVAESDILKAKSLWVSNAESAGRYGRSAVTVYGDVNLYNSVGGASDLPGDSVALLIEGASDVVVKGNLRGDNGGMRSVVVRNGGTLTVEKQLKVQNNNDLIIDNGTVTLRGGLEARSAKVSEGTLTLGGGVVNVTGGITVNHGTVEALNGMQATRGQTWTLQAGGIFKMGDGAIISAAGDAGNWTLAIETNGSTGGQLSLTSAALTALTTSDGIALTLTGLSSAENWEYQLFVSGGDENWQSLAERMLKHLFAGSYYGNGTFSVDESGLVTYTTGSADLVWNGSEGSTTWQVGEEATNWMKGETEGQSFADNDNVTFLDGTGSNEISVSGTVSPGNMTVDGGTWTFSGDGTLELPDKLNLKNIPTVNLNVTTNISGTVTGAGTLNVGGNRTLTLKEGFSTTNRGEGLKISVASGSTLLLDYLSDEHTDYLSGVVLEVSGNMHFTGQHGSDSSATYVVGGLKGEVSNSRVELTRNAGYAARLIIDYNGSDPISYAGAFHSCGATNKTKVALVKRGSGKQILTNGSLDTNSTTVEGGILELGTTTTVVNTWSNFEVKTGGTVIIVHGMTVNGSTVTVSGESPDAISYLIFGSDEDTMATTSTLPTLHLGEYGEVQIGEGKTVSVAALDGIDEKYGDITGAGTLNLTAESGSFGGAISSNFTYNNGSGHFTLTGKFDGGSLAVTSGELTLTGDAASGEVKADTSGNGTLVVNSTEGVDLTGALDTATVTVTNSGAGVVGILGELGSTNTTLNLNTGNAGGTIVLGGNSQLDLSSESRTVTVEGTGGAIVLANVSVKSDFENGDTGRTLRVDTATSGGSSVVNVNGMGAVNLHGITINEHGQLTGVTGTYTVGEGSELSLYFSSENVGTESVAGEGKNALISKQTGQDFTLNASDKEHVTLYLGDDAVTSILGALAGEGAEAKEAYLYLTDGTLTLENFGMDDLTGGDNMSLLKDLKGLEVTLDGGNIKLTGKLEDVFVTKGENTLEGEDVVTLLGGVKATLLASKEDKLTLRMAGTGKEGGDVTVKNLMGVTGSELYLENSDPDGERLQVAFENSKASIPDAGDYPTIGDDTVEGQNTTFNGSLTGREGVDVNKTGAGTLTVGDNYQLADGTTSIQQGALRLRGAENSMEGLKFAYGAAAEGDEKRGLLLDGGKTTIKGQIHEEGDSTDGNAIDMTEGAELVLEGKNTLASTQFTGDGTGTITLKEGEAGDDGASLTLSDSASIKGVGVNLDGAHTVLDVGETTGSILSSLTGNGTLKSKGTGTLTVSGGSFSGTLGKSDDGAAVGTLMVKGGTFTLDNVKTDSNWGLTVEEGAQLNLDLTGSPDDVPAPQFGKVTVNGTLRMEVGTMVDGDDGGKKAPVSGTLESVGSNGKLEVHSNGSRQSSFELGFTAGEESNKEQLERALQGKVTLSGRAFVFDDVAGVNVGDDGTITVRTKEAQDNRFERVMPDAGKNGRAGATMLWGSLKERGIGVLNNLDSDYAKLGNAIIDMMDQGRSGEMERALTAVAGSSIATIAPALTEDLHRQLTSIRNRTTLNGEAFYDEQYDSFPVWHTWINAEGGYHKLNADGYLPGYTLNNWGGSLGVGADVSEATTLGLAVTAMYGDLKPDAADSAKGDLDTVYLSGFVRTMSGAWSHTLVVSGGWAHIDLNRTVNYGSGSYRTKGSTDGYAIGALYELGYTQLMNERGTAALQPVVNVEFRHIGVDGYKETGSDAGLKVDDMRQSILTFGVGARFQCVVSGNAFEHDSIFEARALLKADVGDRSGEVRNGIVGSRTTAEVESAEVGPVGVEVGAGLTVPLGSGNGSVFLDASFEYRQGWSSVNAAAGYKLTF